MKRFRNNYISVIFFIFSVLFVSPVLSPLINGRTIYLYWFVPFFDYQFDTYLIGKINHGKKTAFVIFVFIILFVLLRRNLMIMFKVISLIYTVIYLQYVFQRIGFSLLYKAFNLNIYLAILQFIIYLWNPQLAYQIGPKAIASAIWGQQYSGGNTNFYPVFFNIPRVCGLSREAGFFAALLSVVILIYIVDKTTQHVKSQWVLFIIAYVISFSKMSILLPFLLFVLYFKKTIDRIPIGLGFGFVWLTLGSVSIYLNKIGFFSPSNESIAHRFYGYGIVLNNLSLKEIIIGNSNGLLQLNHKAILEYPIYEYLLNRGFDTFCGYPDLIICFGYLGMIVFLFSMHIMHTKTSGLLILLFATMDVSLTTSTSFVVLTYWLVIHINKVVYLNSSGTSRYNYRKKYI